MPSAFATKKDLLLSYLFSRNLVKLTLFIATYFLLPIFPEIFQRLREAPILVVHLSPRFCKVSVSNALPKESPPPPSRCSQFLDSGIVDTNVK